MTPGEFRAIHDKTAGDLLKFLIRRTSSPEDAADCLAETFLIAWTKRDQMSVDLSQVRPWLFGVARNVIRRDRELDHKASRTVEALALDLRDSQRLVPGDDVVTVALEELSAVDREIIEMMAWDQLAPREIAAILELSPNVVRIRAHRARIKLREQLRSSQALRHSQR